MDFFEFSNNFYAILITVIIIIITYLRYKQTYSLWSSRGVNGPTPLPLLGTTLPLFFDSVPNIFVKNAKTYGRIYGTYDAFGTALVISDPKLVKQICVKDFYLFSNRRDLSFVHKVFKDMLFGSKDKKWKRLRKLISPTFSTGKIKRMKPLIEQCIQNAMEYLELVAVKKEELDVKQFWSRFTLEVIARCCFAADINSHKDPDNEFFRQVTSFFKTPPISRRLYLLLFASLPKFISKFLPMAFVRTETLEYLSKVIIHLLKQRKQSDQKYNDFFQLLIEAEKESEEKSEPLNEDEIIANCILFFIAGYETTANLLNYFTYSMAMNPEIQEKLYHEIKSHFLDKEGIDYEEANKLPYLDAVVSETLRMFPPLANTERIASTEFELEDTGIVVPEKSMVLIPVYAIHRDPEFYPEPESFKPERFLGENKENIDPYTYLPFGVGPRNCVAMRFALIEAKLAIINTLLKFKFEMSEKTPLKIDFGRFNNLLICRNIFVGVKKR